MKRFVYFLAVLAFCSIVAGLPAVAAEKALNQFGLPNGPPYGPAAQAEAKKMRELGVTIDDKTAFTLNDRNRTATLTGHGAAKIENGTASGANTTFTVLFTKTDDPLFNNCATQLADTPPDGARLVVWGFGHSKTAGEGNNTRITLVLGPLTDCRMALQTEPGPGKPPPHVAVADVDYFPETGPPPDDGRSLTDLLGIHLDHDDAIAVDRPYGGSVLLPFDYAYMEKALAPADHEMPEPGTYEEEFIQTLLPDMAKAMHDIIRDKKTTDEEKKAAIRDMARADLSDSDFARLADYGLADPLLKTLPAVDRAQLRFLLNSKTLDDAGRAAKAREFVRSVEARERQRKEAERREQLVALQRALHQVFYIFLSTGMLTFGAISLQRDWKKSGPAGRRRIELVTYALILLLALGLFSWTRIENSPFCGVSPDTIVSFQPLGCLKDVRHIGGPVMRD